MAAKRNFKETHGRACQLFLPIPDILKTVRIPLSVWFVMQNLSKFTQLKQLTLVSSKLIRLRCMKSSIRETKIHNPNYNGRSEQMPTLKCGITPKNLNAWSIILIIYLWHQPACWFRAALARLGQTPNLTRCLLDLFYTALRWWVHHQGKKYQGLSSEGWLKKKKD